MVDASVVHRSASGRVTLEAARHGVAQVAGQLTGLLRSLRDPTTPAVGEWTAGDVAAHLAHVAELDAEAVRGRDPDALLKRRGIRAPRTVEEVGDMTAALLDADPVRDPAAQAARIEEAVAALLDACGEEDRRHVPWLLSTTLPRSAVCSHLVSEMLLHGWDAARAAKLEWTIPAHLARLAIEGFYLPIIPAMDTVDGSPDPSPAACEIRLRGGGRFVLARADGRLSVLDSIDRVDLRVSADPATMLLAMSGRGGGRLARVLTGRMLAWGRHPRRGLRVFAGVRAP